MIFFCVFILWWMVVFDLVRWMSIMVIKCFIIVVIVIVGCIEGRNERFGFVLVFFRVLVWLRVVFRLVLMYMCFMLVSSKLSRMLIFFGVFVCELSLSVCCMFLVSYFIMCFVYGMDRILFFLDILILFLLFLFCSFVMCNIIVFCVGVNFDDLSFLIYVFLVEVIICDFCCVKDVMNFEGVFFF